MKIIRLIFWLIITLFSGKISAQDPVLITLEPHKFYFHPETDNELSFKKYQGFLSTADLDYIIYDLLGNKLMEGSAQTSDNVNMSTSVNLAAGYYRIYFPNNNTYFGLSVLPYRDREPDLFYGVHSNLCRDDELTDLSTSEKKIRHENVVKTLKKTGIGIVRDRVRPAIINPSPGVFNWQGNNHRYEDARKLLEKYNIQIMPFFAFSPPWMKRPEERVGGNPDEHKYPTNLHAMTTAWDSIYRRWSKVMTKIEVWNEPRGGTQERLAPLVHSMAYTFDKLGHNTEMVGCAFTSRTLDKYSSDMAQMKCFEALDVYSFHQYTKPEIAGNMLMTIRKTLDNCDQEYMPVMNSESGAQYIG
ncbi:MAG: hypothetical protein ACOCUP_00335, partial [bacterium]